MTNMIRPGSDNIAAVKNDGTVVTPARASGCTLGVGTYYFPVGSSEAPTSSETPLVSAHLKWAAAVAATITVETCNFPAKVDSHVSGPTDVSDYDETAGNWISENPTTAYVAVSGSGNSSTAAVVTAGGTAAGGCTFHLGNLGTRRVRIKVVTTVGGVVRCGIAGKD